MYVSDTLTGSGVLGSNWTLTGTWERTGSGARQTNSVSSYFKAAWTGSAMEGQDYRVSATIGYDTDANIGAGVACRWATGTTVSGYVLVRFATEVYRVELNAGAEVSPTLVSTPGTGSIALRIECEGNQIRSYVGGTLVNTLTDSTYATGTPGLVAYGGAPTATNYILNWSAIDIYERAMRRWRGYALY